MSTDVSLIVVDQVIVRCFINHNDIGNMMIGTEFSTDNTMAPTISPSCEGMMGQLTPVSFEIDGVYAVGLFSEFLK